MRFTKVKIFNSATNLNDTIFIDALKPIGANLVAITNFHSFFVDTLRRDEFRIESFPAIMRPIVEDSVNFVEIVDFLMLCSGRADDFTIRLLSRVGNLRNPARIGRIAFSLQKIKSLLEFFSRDIQISFGTKTHIQHTFLINHLFESVSCSLSGERPSFRILLQITANRGLVNTLAKSLCHSSGDFASTKFLFIL